jgi:hypothetical protein
MGLVISELANSRPFQQDTPGSILIPIADGGLFEMLGALIDETALQPCGRTLDFAGPFQIHANMKKR